MADPNHIKTMSLMVPNTTNINKQLLRVTIGLGLSKSAKQQAASLQSIQLPHVLMNMATYVS